MYYILYHLYINRAHAAGIDLILPTPGTPLNSTSISPNDILPKIADQILHILTFLAYPIAFIGIIYSAYFLLFANDKPESFTKTKNNLIYMIIGFLLILVAALLVNWLGGLFNTPA
jgi:hypothetical protein